MKIALTGATGFVGSHVLTELREHGHEVTAFVRDDAQADRVAAPPRPWLTCTTGPLSRACSATRTGPSTPPARATPPALAAARNRTKAPIRHRYGQPVTKLLQTGKHLARTPGARPPERIP